MYHYVFTWQFPYTVSCFRGTPATRTIFGGASTSPGAQTPGSAGPSGPGSGGGPPPSTP